MASLLIRNIGRLVTGDLARPLAEADSLFIEDGLIREVGTARSDADIILDARGLTAIPGLIDGHCHPTVGQYDPVQNAVGWIGAYLHCGVTSLVSAGELHFPGLPLNPPDPKVFKYLAVLSKRCADQLRPAGAKLHAGTLLLAPGLTEADFDEIAQEGIRCVKFIFYPFGSDWAEAQSYVRWARQRGLVSKLHSGGVSRTGVSRPAGAEVVLRLRPDVVGHITGGPIPMPLEEMEIVVKETDCYLEIASAGNYRRGVELMGIVLAQGALHRVTLGTDTPSGTGILPRGMLRNLLFLASLTDLKPEQAVCLATGNTARAHHLAEGIIAPGKPADLVLLGKIRGSVAKDGLDCLKVGDLPGISTVLVDGRILVRGRSQQTPPPEVLAEIVKGGEG